MNKAMSKTLKGILAGVIATSVISTPVFASEIKSFELSEESIIYEKNYGVEKYEFSDDNIIYEDEDVTVKVNETKKKKSQPKTKVPKKKTTTSKKPVPKAPAPKVITEETEEKKAPVPKPAAKAAVKEVEEKVEKPEVKEAEPTKAKQGEVKGRVYLSQSTQFDNAYHSGTTTEGDKMGELSKIVEKYLLEKGYEVLKNSTDMDFKESLRHGNSLEDIDAYVALHSNGHNKQARGPLTIRSSKDKDKGLAEAIYDSLIEIYPEKQYGRGVMVNDKYAETNGTKAPSTIVEVAFHDNVQDEKWILENLEKIGSQIADGIEKYCESK